jgi:adenosylcobinamide amidohydrolase
VLWGNETRRALVARSNRVWHSLSWAPGGGGQSTTTTYCCLEVKDADLPIGVAPEDVIARFTVALDVKLPVATLTSANVGTFYTATAREGETAALVVVTAGFSNALRVGERSSRPTAESRLGTINIACWMNRFLSFEAQLEALSIVAEARTLAVLEAKITSSDRSGLATGTGTDCIALFTHTSEPNQGGATGSMDSTAPVTRYAGLHTSVGRVLGSAVREAVREAACNWAKQHTPPQGAQVCGSEP